MDRHFAASHPGDGERVAVRFLELVDRAVDEQLPELLIVASSATKRQRWAPPESMTVCRPAWIEPRSLGVRRTLEVGFVPRSRTRR